MVATQSNGFGSYQEAAAPSLGRSGINLLAEKPSHLLRLTPVLGCKTPEPFAGMHAPTAHVRSRAHARPLAPVLTITLMHVTFIIMVLTRAPLTQI